MVGAGRTIKVDRADIRKSRRHRGGRAIGPRLSRVTKASRRAPGGGPPTTPPAWVLDLINARVPGLPREAGLSLQENLLFRAIASPVVFRTIKDTVSSHSGPNVSSAAQSGSHITSPALTTITGNVHIIQNAPASSSVILKYKKLICSEYQYVTEYNSVPGEHAPPSERYTQPLILKKHRDQKEREEEIRSRGESFQKVLRSRSSEDSVHLNSLFDPDGHGISPRAVILQGNSGNGKSFTVQKIMMDWASGYLYKKREGAIIDGFDELRLTEGIYDMQSNTDLLQKASPVVILCDLLRGRILPESFLLVTSRSTAVTLSELLKRPQRFSEIIGFSEKGVEEYFLKFFQNEELFRKAYTLVKANETLITACSIPVICWIICTTIKERFKIDANVTNGLETTTSIYVDFVFTLLKYHCQGQSVLTLLRSLGQLAERGILEQQVLFDEKRVNEMVSNPSGCPFLCKILFKRRIHQETMFSFMHLSFQEFFTALYYVLLDEEESKRKLTEILFIKERPMICSLHLPAVVEFAYGLLNKDVRCTLKKHDLSVCPKTQAHLQEWTLKMLLYYRERHVRLKVQFAVGFMNECLHVYAHAGGHFDEKRKGGKMTKNTA
ncbi:NACHT, LRR and PYD domains-containing protein 3 [Anabarilius grahami]|uniref:NACHT, LRR and PYD domains-containing protein 3 n=1 Tax=Anabarilius grahami TaxID=495550 RepID=A0A3N0Z2B2_ANAGA|nr:NACHT, LRR and PYD domains-containing protein 3 [Anabarilius grahami]